MSLIRIELPAHLRTLARISGEAAVDVTPAPGGAVTLRAAIEALEAAYPALRGTIREYSTGERRAFLRFFACHEDLSHQGIDALLPTPIAEGLEPLLIIGAIAGG